MSNARILADLMGTSTTVPSSKLSLVSTDMPTGTILQVKHTTIQSTQSIAYNAAQDTALTGFSLSITPSSTSSKILIMAQIMSARSDGDSRAFLIDIYRDSTKLTAAAATAQSSQLTAWIKSVSTESGNADHGEINDTGFYLDSPSTTSSVTYSLKQRHQTNSNMNFLINRNGSDENNGNHWEARGGSQFMLMEVAG